MPSRIALSLLCLLVAPPAWAGPSSAGLASILPLASTVPGGFEAVEELPAELDADLRAWGVRAQRARHYTRYSGPGEVQVCSIEIWAFADADRAAAAEAGFRAADWEFSRRGALLLMARGLTREPGKPPRRGVFPDCRRVFRAAEARAPASR